MHFYSRCFILQIVNILIAFNIISCGCNNQKGTGNGDQLLISGKLTMEIENVNLVGGQKKITAFIKLGNCSEPVLLKNYILKVRYMDGAGNLEFTTYKNGISGSKQASSINEKLSDLVLFAELNPDDAPLTIPFLVLLDKKIAQATIQLELIDEAGHLIESTVTWSENKLIIEGLNKFVGTNLAKFNLRDPNNYFAETANMVVEVESSNSATFQLVKQDGALAKNPVNLSELFPASQTGGLLPLSLKVDNPHGESEATVTVTINQGKIILVNQSVSWENQGVSLDINLKNLVEKDISFSDQAILTADIKNKGVAINTDKIKFRLVNDKGIKFKVGNLSASDIILTDLNSLVEKSQLAEKELASFTVQQVHNPQDVYGADLTLEFLDDKGDLLYKKELTWVDTRKVQAIKETANKLDVIEQEIIALEQLKVSLLKENKYADLFSGVKNILIKRAYVQQISREFQNIDPNKVPCKLKAYIDNQIDRTDKLIKSINAYKQESIKFFQQGINEPLQRIAANIQAAKTIDINRFIQNMKADFNQIETFFYDISAKLGKPTEDTKDIITSLKHIIQQIAEDISRDMVKLVKEFKNIAEIQTLDANESFRQGGYKAQQIANFLSANASDFDKYAVQAYQYTAEAMLAAAKKENKLDNILEDAKYALKAALKADFIARRFNENLKDNNSVNRAACAALQAAKEACQLADRKKLFEELELSSKGETISGSRGGGIKIFDELSNKLKEYGIPG